MGTGRYDGIDVLVLRTVADQNDAVRLDLLEDLLELRDQRQVGSVTDLLIAADQCDIGLVSVLLDLQADADSRVERIEIGILWIRYSEGCGRVQAVLHPYDRGVHLALDAEVVVPIDDQDQSLLHASESPWALIGLPPDRSDTVRYHCWPRAMRCYGGVIHRQRF